MDLLYHLYLIGFHQVLTLKSLLNEPFGFITDLPTPASAWEAMMPPIPTLEAAIQQSFTLVTAHDSTQLDSKCYALIGGHSDRNWVIGS